MFLRKSVRCSFSSFAMPCVISFRFAQKRKLGLHFPILSRASVLSLDFWNILPSCSFPLEAGSRCIFALCSLIVHPSEILEIFKLGEEFFGALRFVGHVTHSAHLFFLQGGVPEHEFQSGQGTGKGVFRLHSFLYVCACGSTCCFVLATGVRDKQAAEIIEKVYV